jgi:hypothetical protein
MSVFLLLLLFSLQVRCSNVKMSPTIVKRSFHPIIILPYACYQSVTNAVWASVAVATGISKGAYMGRLFRGKGRLRYSSNKEKSLRISMRDYRIIGIDKRDMLMYSTSAAILRQVSSKEGVEALP